MTGSLQVCNQHDQHKKMDQVGLDVNIITNCKYHIEINQDGLTNTLKIRIQVTVRI